MIRYMDDIQMKGRRVFIRADFNVPLDDFGNITDDNRIRAVLPTINHALDEGAKVILCSHLGRPKGQRVEKFSLKPVARRLSRLLQKEVALAPDCVGPEVERMAAGLGEGDVLLLENVRFHEGETRNDPEFAAQLAALCEVFVNDAFAVSHRAHASVVGIPPLVKDCAGGHLLRAELTYFHRAMEDPARPLVAIVGGAKVSSKLGALENLLARVDKIVIGGAMANTFLMARGYPVGRSLVEPDLVETARKILDRARSNGIRIYLPVDCVVADRMEPNAETKIVPAKEVPDGWMILDIGPATVALFREVLHNARTIVWNGPMGAFEMDAFSRGTLAMVRAVADSYALTIIGGGDTDVAVHKAGEVDNISYISTGGGAFLALLEGKELPGIKALETCGGGG
ncbi:phosphoglycerate kinase [Dissulfurirhabdus thermomarina]|uniref:Phosphoglycerate kinase n=1 Tax=Dissulfurirhabdus thermomarina TaxID=1765737 RepID=A0A6N9TKZ4_DISTH|nr:phosphoglycerate kinase [Dissulfurirhabdus thermomarina]NDY41738.1 phosphoglycerate kinase [Dissulfurirhabdus thermomarina]NMX23674.1 phosphoglycerate kinase [Dissulfurirhabdus thermomarina]